MPKLFFSVFCLVFSLSSFAQADKDEYSSQVKEFVSQFLKDSAKPVVVAEKLDSFTISTIKDQLIPDSFFRRTSADKWKTVIIDTFGLSPEERRYLDSSTTDLYNSSWQAAWLPPCTILDQQGIDALMASGPAMPKYLKTTFNADRFYWLSKPIFLRNYSFCIFYCETNNGKPSGSSASLLIFSRKNRKWEKLMKLKAVEVD